MQAFLLTGLSVLAMTACGGPCPTCPASREPSRPSVPTLAADSTPSGAPAPPSAAPIDERQSVAVKEGEPIRLTGLEFRLLQFLLANAGHTLPAERLTSHVWGDRGTGDRQLLKQLVRRLRQKIEVDPADPRYLTTVSGVGYLFRASSAAK